MLALLAFLMALTTDGHQVTFLWIKDLSQRNFYCGPGCHSPVYSAQADSGQGGQGPLAPSLFGAAYEVSVYAGQWYTGQFLLLDCSTVFTTFFFSCLFSEIPQGVFQCDAPV